jgi:DNA internalization-related competence protein ComEC/Rec2
VIGPILPAGPSPALPAAIALVAGTWLGAWSVCGGRLALVLAGLCGLLIGLAAATGRRTVSARAVFPLLWCAAGFASGNLRIAAPAEQARQAAGALDAAERGAVRVEGVLADFWTGSAPRARSRLQAERVWSRGTWREFPAEVYVFVGGETPVEGVADRGDRVVLSGSLRQDDLPASTRDVSLPWPAYRLSVKSALQITERRGTPLSVMNEPNRRLHARLPPAGGPWDRDVRGPLSALLLGRTADLDRGMVASYRRGGVYHLLVVSGLHVVLAAGIALAALRRLRVEGKLRDALLLAAMAFFVALAGANPPAVRAGIVLGVYLAARLLERPVPAAQAIGLSALLLFSAAPEQIFSIGTVLTFAAVCGIALFTAPLRRLLPEKPAWLFSGLAVSLAAQIGTAPIAFWRFNVISAGAWITAPLSIPLSGALIALGAVLLTFLAAGLMPVWLLWLFALGSRTLEWIAERAAGMAFLRPTPELRLILVVILLVAAAALAPARLRLPAAAAAAVLFLLLALSPGPAAPPLGFSIEALDVGQGDALLLRWRRHALLVDGGGPFDLDARDYGRTRLVPKLLDRGVTRLDAVLVTHPHPDHALGVFAVLDELPVGQLWRSSGQDDGELYTRLTQSAAARRVPVKALEAGQAARWPDARLAVLHSGGRLRKLDGINNQSVVALFERHGVGALLTGDTGMPTERDLLEAGAPVAARVLKVGHHGSRTATSPEFLRAVAPRAALLSCGRENRFGHPAPETLATLSDGRVRVLRTDVLSDVRLTLEPSRTLVFFRGTR